MGMRAVGVLRDASRLLRLSDLDALATTQQALAEGDARARRFSETDHALRRDGGDAPAPEALQRLAR